jgi:hypothetical protein
VDALHEFSQKYATAVVLQHQATIYIAVGGNVSTSKLAGAVSAQKLAAHATVWHVQLPTKPFEALSSSVLEILS